LQLTALVENRSFTNSGVASQNIGGGNVFIQANNAILFGKTPLKAQNGYMFCSATRTEIVSKY